MRAAAWRWLNRRGPVPTEIIAARAVDRFGAQGVYGRPMFYREMARIMAVENIERAWAHKKRAEKPTFWAIDNPDLAAILKDAEACANG